MWQHLLEQAQLEQTSKTNAIIDFTPLNDGDKSYREQQIGEVRGLRWFKQTLDSEIEALQLKQQQDERRESTESTDEPAGDV